LKTTTQFCSQKGQVTEQILAQGPEAMIQDHIACPAPKVKTGEKPLNERDASWKNPQLSW